jgi:hypothetical protein
MRSFPYIDYQRQLIFASLDDFTPSAALPNYRGGQYGEEHKIWHQAVIDFLCINVKCGFIEATHRSEIRAGYDARKLEYILLNGENDKNIDKNILWNILYFNGTDKLVEIIEKLGLRSWNCANSEKECEDFIAILNSAYGIEELNHCRVCGFDLGEPIWGETGTDPSFEICPCCGAQFGYSDTSPEKCARFRQYWIEKEGAAWRMPGFRPKDWSLEKQLRNLPPGYREI